jgi:branched-chain amino acid transport system permease protein
VNATLFYLTTLLVYGAVDVIACLGLSQQFGVAGVTNFGFIIFQATGAYTAAVLSLPADSANGGFQSYIGGWGLPFPFPWIGAAIAGALVALPFTFLVGRRLRGDFAAVGLLVSAVMLNLLVTNYVPLFNGDAGVSIVPAPLQGEFNPQDLDYQLLYSAGAIVLAYLCYRLVRRITESPYGRSLRAMRDNDVVADSLGKDLRAMRATMLALGGALAGLSGAILVGFITLWAPSAWTYAETIVLFAAVIIGGAGNHRGAVLGALLVPLGFEEASRYIPAVGPPALIPALQWVAIGLLIVIFLWFRPQGVLPERRRLLSGLLTTGRIGSAPGWSRRRFTARMPGDAGAAGAAEGLDTAETSPALRLTGLVSSHPAGARPERAAEEESVILATKDLSCAFGGVLANDRVSLTVQRGRVTGLIGPNGAGKSTLMGLLSGTLTPTSGRIYYRGQDITGVPAHLRARSGLVRTWQLASEFKRLTVLENLVCAAPAQPGDTFGGSLRGPHFWRGAEREIVQRASTVLDRFGLTEHADTYAGDLSGGQRRLVEIMRALMTEPELLLLDEPMAGVHPRLARRIGAGLVELCGEGLTILLVEHELAIMDEFCDPVVVMADGQILAEGTMALLRQRPEVVEAYLVG